MKHLNKEHWETHERLNAEASPSGAIIAALMTVPAIIIYYWLVFDQFGFYQSFSYYRAKLFFIVLMALPPIFMGLAARFAGREFETRPLALIATIAGTLHSLAIYYFEGHRGLYLMIPVVVVLAYTTSHRHLNPLESLVVQLKKEGRFDP